jgi:probable rRNA maturation factor
LSISFISQSNDYKPENLFNYRSWLKKVIGDEGYKLGEIQYIFVSVEKIIQINESYLNHYYPTDIITFDNSYLNTISGDIFICIDVVKENSYIHSNGVFINELDRVIIHGLLHLLGYQDNTSDTKKVMRNKEDFYLKYLD